MKSWFNHGVHLLRRVTLAVQKMPSTHSGGLINTHHLNSCNVRQTREIRSNVRTHSTYSTQARSQWDASRCNTHLTNMDAPTRNSQNIKDRHADRPTKNVRRPSYPGIPVGQPWLESTCKVFCAMLHTALCD